MPLEKSSEQAVPTDDLDLDALFASQQSSGSETDDSAMMAMMAKKMHEAAEKKARERDAKLVQAFNNESKKLLASRVTEATALIAELAEEQEALATEDAQNEDALRALWAEVAELRGQQKTTASRRAESQKRVDQQRRKANIDAVKVTDELGS